MDRERIKFSQKILYHFIILRYDTRKRSRTGYVVILTESTFPQEYFHDDDDLSDFGK